jgi:glycosyltransferase involved in cell wall biosynthesis
VLAPTLAPVTAIALQPIDLGLNWFAPGLVRTLRRERPEVVLLMGRMANNHGERLAAALPGAVVVGTMRTGKALPRGFRRSLPKVAHVVANSAESARILAERYGLGAERVSVIHNALVFSPPGEAITGGTGAVRSSAAEAFRQAQGVAGGAVVLLCVGMFRREKNQRALIETAARLPSDCMDWRLWFVGEGPEREACAALAKRLGLERRVRFFGFQADPRPFYAAADVAVLASRAESLSNFLIEAQAHGLPVVAARATGVDECIEDGAGGILVPADDAGAFANALIRYLVDPAARSAAGAAAVRFARTAFSPKERALEYLTLFTRLRGKNGDCSRGT